MKNNYVSGARRVLGGWLEYLQAPEVPRKERLWWALLGTAVWFFLANGFSFVNYFPVHDALGFTAGGAVRDWQLQQGRFLIPLYMALRGPLAVPVLTGALSMLYLGLSVSLICHILGFRSRLQIILSAGFLSVNLFTLEISAVHQYFADVFLLALLLCCLGVRLILHRTDLWSILLSALCLFLSFGLYPAFLTTAVCLFLGAAVLETARSSHLSHGFLKRAGLHLGVLLVSGVLYLVCAQAVLSVTGLSAASSGILSPGSLNPAKLLDSAMRNVRLFYRALLDGTGFAGRGAGVAAIALLLLGLYVFVRNRLKKPAKWIIALPLLLFVLFPPLSRLINIMTGENTAYRTAFAQFLFLPVMTGLLFSSVHPRSGQPDRPVSARVFSGLAVLCCGVILFAGARYANGAGTVQKIRYDRAVFHTGQVLADIEAFERENGPAQKLAVLGTFETPTDLDPLLSPYRNIGGLGADTGITYEQTFFQLARLLGRQLPWRQEYTNAARAREETAAMPSYPARGYIAQVGESLVVKLGPVDSRPASQSFSWVLQPNDRQAAEGETVSFYVMTDETVNYQWQYSRDGEEWKDLSNGSFWRGNRTDTLTFRAEQNHDGLLVRCAAEKWGRVLYSDPARLTVLADASDTP